MNAHDSALADPARASFETLTADASTGVDLNLDVILDVSVSLSLEVGRTRIPIRNLLQLNQGSVVELERGAGEPLDVFVNGTQVLKGGESGEPAIAPGYADDILIDAPYPRDEAFRTSAQYADWCVRHLCQPGDALARCPPPR